MSKITEVRAYLSGVLEGKVFDPTTLYALRVLGSGKRIIGGPHVRAAAQRHLDDLAREDLVWDLQAANRIIRFFPDVLVFTDGDRAGEPFVLELWQAFIVGCLFGWKGLDGWRRFRTAYVEVGKGNGKSPLAGGIGLYMMVADGEAAPEVYAAAPTLNQAKILWVDAKRMVESSQALRNRLDPRAHVILYPDKYGVFKPISSEKRGLDGHRIHAGLVDELHEHSDGMVVNKIRAGTKARKQALIFEITNSGFDRTSVCFQHHEYGLRILRGQEQNDSWFFYIAALDEGDDWENDQEVWVKANPNLGISITKKYLQEQVDDSKGIPSKRSLTERLNFCRWVGASDPWISEDKWRACLLDGQQVEWASLRDVPCYAAVDLSSSRDLTALALVWKLEDCVLARVFYFMPEDNLDERVREDKVQYDVWAREGYIELTPGPVVDFAFVAQRLKDLSEDFNLVECGFDPWRIKHLQAEMGKIGCAVALRHHGQGFVGGRAKDNAWMPTSLEQLEKLILNTSSGGRTDSGDGVRGMKYYVEDNPVTTMCVANAVTRADPAGNRAFTKEKATGRMDGTVAQAMAVGCAFFIPDSVAEGPSVYEERGLLVL